MNKNPLVSIVIPVYNGSNYVAEAIESAIAQTYQNIEILVINDGSNDGGATEEVVNRYASRVTYIKKSNGGVATALNLGIREMRGEYFSWLSHDDYYDSDKIKSQIDFLNGLNSHDVVVYSDHYNLLEVSRKTFLRRHTESSDLEFRAREIVANNQIHGCSLLIPRKAFDRVGLFDESLRVAQDYELWFRIAKEFPFRHLKGAVITGRIHDKQVGVRLHDRVVAENDQFRLSCLKQLDSDEVQALGKGSVALGILHLSMRMYKMGCPLSHAYLLLSLKRLILCQSINERQRLLTAFAIALDACYRAALGMARKLKSVLGK